MSMIIIQTLVQPRMGWQAVGAQEQSFVAEV
jgi:hypothetical protein